MEVKVLIEMVSKLHWAVIFNLKKQFSTFELEGKRGKEISLWTPKVMQPSQITAVVVHNEAPTDVFPIHNEVYQTLIKLSNLDI